MSSFGIMRTTSTVSDDTSSSTSANEKHAVIHGDRFNESYEEVEKLGEGGFGQIFKVKHTIDGLFYAVKRIEITPESSQEKALKEANILANLSHDNIVRYFDSFITDCPCREGVDRSSIQSGESIGFAKSVEDGIKKVDISTPNAGPGENTSVNTTVLGRQQLLYIRMELCDSSLRMYLDQAAKLRSDEVWHVMRALVAALEYLGTKNLVHRDIKPENVLLKKKTGDSAGVELLQFDVKLGDFGLVQSPGSGKSGSALYQSPEQKNDGKYTCASDIYSLGLILLELLHNAKTYVHRCQLFDDVCNRKLPKLDKCEETLLLKDTCGMLHPEVQFRTKVAKVKEHIESFHKLTNDRDHGEISYSAPL